MLYADAIDDRSALPTSARRDVAGRISARLRSLVVAAAQARVARRAERHLIELPDHLLKDIGISRSGIRRAVRQGRT